eukprot:1515708-Amphidinium_carterae.1
MIDDVVVIKYAPCMNALGDEGALGTNELGQLACLTKSIRLGLRCECRQVQELHPIYNLHTCDGVTPVVLHDKNP